MCDKCVTVGQELEAFVDDLLVKYPGTVIEGEEADPEHHVAVAVASLAMRRFPEVLAIVVSMALEAGAQMEAAAFGGGGLLGMGREGQA